MRHHASSSKTVARKNKHQAPVIPIGVAAKKSSKQHGKVSKDKSKQELPLFYTQPIFKAKEHDPL